MTEANLAALWRNYAALGYRRLVYSNTVSVLEPDLIARAMGGTPRITAVLLTADDATARRRLGIREIGSQLDAHLTPGNPAERDQIRKIMNAVRLADQTDVGNLQSGQSRETVACLPTWLML
jgi:hypothetical protein